MIFGAANSPLKVVLLWPIFWLGFFCFAKKRSHLTRCWSVLYLHLKNTPPLCFLFVACSKKTALRALTEPLGAQAHSSGSLTIAESVAVGNQSKIGVLLTFG